MKVPQITLASGFTLVELMVVLVVLAVAASMVTLSVSGASGHALEGAAEHLSSTLEDARWQAISTGRQIAWEAPQSTTPGGSAIPEARWYEQTPDRNWHLRAAPAAIPPLAGLTLRIVRPLATNEAPARLVLGPEPVGVAACILLTQEDNTVAVVSDGVAPFSVQRNGHF